ncbi:CDP-alcohol phosphatidyltransferase family protein [Nonomuraea diastatica]|uniref:CDP-alcohol phosphatidyltransferase family protein n=1 Tax=Nonomuraea diastatica TaxID=1848329 RepID=A0A4R4WUI2_9ACTN|nr:CDP-alcohol phosphatidyltransferase family protein [Nonomuraea diastatica]TDD21310.1 CDP-alcohol phosphatidyltransferase family protein [Nonomuraea diastatica]
MTRVVLLGASPGPETSPTGLRLAALTGNPTVAERLRSQVTSMDPRPATIESGDVAAALRALADVAASATENLFIIPTNSVVHDELIYQITKSKRGALALVAKEPRYGITEEAQEDTGQEDNGQEDGDDESGQEGRVPIAEAEPEIGYERLEGLPVRARIGKSSRVVSVGTAHHAVTRPNAALLGPLHVSARNAPVLAQTCRELAEIAHRFGDDDDLVQLIVFGLVRNGVSVGIRGRRDLFYRRVTTQEEVNEAGAEMTGMDEDRSRLNNAVKGADGFFTTYFVSTYSRFIARWAARRGLTPNQVTLISIALGVAAAACFATGDRPWMVAGGILIYFAFVFDCVDGQVARYARKFGVLGAWLDATFDRFKEYVVFAGLAIGWVVSGNSEDIWILALAAIGLQSVRHLLDFSFGISNRRKPPAKLPTVALDAPDDRDLREALTRRKVERSQGVRGVLKMWSKAGKNRAVHWARKMIVFPIGERFAAIAITAALFDARITFITLVIWGSVAAIYTLTGRLMRSLV